MAQRRLRGWIVSRVSLVLHCLQAMRTCLCLTVHSSLCFHCILAGISSGAKKVTSAANRYCITIHWEQLKFNGERVVKGCCTFLTTELCWMVDQVQIHVEINKFSRFVYRGGIAYLRTVIWEIKNECGLNFCQKLHQKKNVAVNTEITLWS